MGDTPAQDYDEITKAIQPYLDGAKAGNGDAMKPAFHADATIYGYIGDTRVSGPIKLLYDWVDSIGPAPAVTPRIVKVDVVGTAANVRIEVDNWQQYRFTDLLNLLRIDGKWVIVNKIFHTHG